MKQFVSLLTILGCFSLFAQSETFNYGTHQQGERILPFRILLPKTYDKNKKYPLLLFLHGAGERGNDNILQLTHGSDQFLKESFRQNQPAIVVFPQCPKGEYWASVSSREGPLKFTFPKKPKHNPVLDLVEGMLKELRSKYPIDKNRIYVGGLSMGGMGTFEMVYRNPRLFAAAFAICGGANPKISRKIRRPSWRIDHGEADEVVPVQLSILMENALRQKKAVVELNLYPKVNHSSWDNVFADDSFLPWLFSQKK